ncbi:hypothetical protein PUNSTDRAFT_53829 [Punctularia strigosozonata HHB-11173 SS5]|uniref:uncharacterized protein n=1 Tax=Punctularia strigosozonata (strain HHB-11173) TaxID=741275 RepID=UPI0004416D3D|nr:uncharacterized protein PUNSTDRAFT_53829 [Punctularia strigosozonata HHB-11173 SS5]EIN07503.1 hypothetical protein PUNSTDRAFT_53829 [Punctularia strigosozonata HHB-11173 SS5]
MPRNRCKRKAKHRWPDVLRTREVPNGISPNYSSPTGVGWSKPDPPAHVLADQSRLTAQVLVYDTLRMQIHKGINYLTQHLAYASI